MALLKVNYLIEVLSKFEANIGLKSNSNFMMFEYSCTCAVCLSLMLYDFPRMEW